MAKKYEKFKFSVELELEFSIDPEIEVQGSGKTYKREVTQKRILGELTRGLTRDYLEAALNGGVEASKILNKKIALVP